MRISSDILISGGGIAGLSAAAAFGSAGFRVICVDPAKPVTSHHEAGVDLRTTAILQKAIVLLSNAGLWERLLPYASPLSTMRIINAKAANTPHSPLQVETSRDFMSLDVPIQDGTSQTADPFGWNIANWILRKEILARLKELPNVDFYSGQYCQSLITRDNNALVTLSDGLQICTKMVVAADGRNSFIRQNLGIGVCVTRYEQKALAFSVTHPIPHNNTSTEIHFRGGPFTLVPLPDVNKSPASAIVWMDKSTEINRLNALSADAFKAELDRRSCLILGPLTPITKISQWSIISQIADRMYGPRTALIAEAAHVVPPIGAQGLNTSYTDLSVLLDLAKENPDAIGDEQMLLRYHHKRHLDVKLRMAGIEFLNRASIASSPSWQKLRGIGLSAFHDIPIIRQKLMKLGLGL